MLSVYRGVLTSKPGLLLVVNIKYIAVRGWSCFLLLCCLVHFVLSIVICSEVVMWNVLAEEIRSPEAGSSPSWLVLSWSSCTAQCCSCAFWNQKAIVRAILSIYDCQISDCAFNLRKRSQTSKISIAGLIFLKTAIFWRLPGLGKF
jgi:hypothetical protein